MAATRAALTGLGGAEVGAAPPVGVLAAVSAAVFAGAVVVLLPVGAAVLAGAVVVLFLAVEVPLIAVLCGG